MKSKPLSILFLILGGITLLIVYPVVFVIVGVSLQAPHQAGLPLSQVITGKTLLICGAIYPLIYIGSLVGYFACRVRNEKAAFRFSAAPIVYLLFLSVLCVALWIMQAGS